MEKNKIRNNNKQTLENDKNRLKTFFGDDSQNKKENKTVINVENLDLFYDDFQALKNVFMDIRQNEITAFIGPSGCGKSTTLKCFNRMNDLVDGCKINGLIEINGK